MITSFHILSNPYICNSALYSLWTWESVVKLQSLWEQVCDPNKIWILTVKGTCTFLRLSSSDLSTLIDV